MKQAFMSSAELERKMARTKNRKKRRAIAHTLFLRWRHSLRHLAPSDQHFEAINYGTEYR